MIQWPLRAFLFICMVQIVSCTKSVDTMEGSASLEISSDAVVASEFRNCKLRNIYHLNTGGEGTTKGTFTYNSAGNPLSLIYGAQASQENPNHYFFYDKQNRLREYRQTHVFNGVEYSNLHKYGYNSNGVLVLDSAITYGVYDEYGKFHPGDTTLITLIYDAQGRISKERIRNPFDGSIRNPTYTYDARGNLAVAGWKSSSYDNKVSIFRSHPVFQFIHRNYSKNNAAPQPKYNSLGLPLSVNPSNDIFFNSYSTVFGSQYGITKALYDCQ